MKFLATDYAATGEGTTICLMITNTRIPQPEDLFREKFGDYFTIGLEELDQETMLKRYKAYIPKIVKRDVENEVNAYFVWSAEFHKNMS